MRECLWTILRCPITKGALREMDVSEIKELNNRISKGELVHFDRILVKREITAAFVSINGQFVYPVEEGIVILLQNLAIVLDESGLDRTRCFENETKSVQDFYDQVGWQKEDGGLFVDALKFEDVRPVSKDYIHKCHLRVNRHLKPSGKYFLDVASGPIQYPEYLSYSTDFDVRICRAVAQIVLFSL